MPRKKNPEYFKFFQIKIEGHGLTKEQALHNYLEDAKYKSKWIKGKMIESTYRQDFNHSDGSWTMYSFRKYIQARYADDEDSREDLHSEE